jgi:glutathione S-transferase
VLNSKVRAGEFIAWNYLSISLFCLVDWILFRELVDLTKYPELLNFRTQNLQQAAVDVTDPRLG